MVVVSLLIDSVLKRVCLSEISRCIAEACVQNSQKTVLTIIDPSDNIDLSEESGRIVED